MSLFVCILILACIIPFIVYFIYCFYKSYELAFFGSHPKRNKFNKKDIKFKYDEFKFSSNKVTLSGVIYKPNTKPKGTVIACHYLGGSKFSIYSYIEPLLKNGYNVAAFDYPNHGESMDSRGNKYTLDEDMNLFVKIIRNKLDGPYGTIGFSMGATTALSILDKYNDIKAAVLDSGPLIYVKDYFIYILTNKKIKNRLIRTIFTFMCLHINGFSRMSRRMKKRLKRLKGFPVLMIHCKKDSIISFKNALYAYKNLESENSRLESVDKGHHLTNKVVLGEKYDRMIVDFFDKWLTEKVNE